MARINSRQVEAFRAVMLSGSVTEAAKLVSVTQPDLLPKSSQIFKLFYDNDILEEEVIFAWYDKPTKKFTSDKNLAIKVRENTKTLIDWLKEAEEESEEE